MRLAERIKRRRLVRNVFCPTGPGGGIDPTCSPNSRLSHPESRQEAENRANIVSDELFGKDSQRDPHEVAKRIVKLPGNRFIQVSMVERYGSSEPYMIQIDFGVTGLPNTHVFPSIETESVAMLKKVRDAVKAYHEFGFKIKVVPSDARRKEVYEKMLSKMGLTKVSEGQQGQQVWNISDSITINPFVSEAQRSACYAKDDPAWDCAEWESNTKGKLPKRKRQAVRNRLRRKWAMTHNSFCPTGKGGGIDPTCSPEEIGDTWSDYAGGYAVKEISGGGVVKVGDVNMNGGTVTAKDVERYGRVAKALQHLAERGNTGHTEVWRGFVLPEGSNLRDQFKHNKVITFDKLTAVSDKQEIAKNYTDPQYIGEEKGMRVLLRMGRKGGVVGYNNPHGELSGAESIIPAGSKFRVQRIYKEGDTHVIVMWDKGDLSKFVTNRQFTTNSVDPLKLDPTRTVMLRRQFYRAINARLNELKKRITTLVLTEKSFTLNVENADYKFLSLPAQVEAFRKWLAAQITTLFGSTTEQIEHSFWYQFIQKGFEKGAGRAFDQLSKHLDISVAKNLAKWQFLRDSFAQPVSIDKVKLVAGRVFTELKGVTDTMAQGITRTLADGLVQGQSPRVVAKAMAKTVDDIGSKRALVIARTETSRAHAEGQLIAMQKLGAQRLQVQVEWSPSGLGTTKLGNPSPCPLCAEHAGQIYTIDKAQWLIPHHPNCLCSWIPFTKFSKKTPTTNLAWNVFCPTGPGGGIDPTCSPSGPHSWPADPLNLKVVKSLPGSTGAVQVQDEHGNLYVRKTGKHPDHLRSEFHAEEAYRAAGVLVPDSKLYELEGGPVKLSKWIDGTMLNELPSGDQSIVRAALQKDFAADAILADWDVVGLQKDNILMATNGDVYRIDVGGSLEYRAQGSPKGSLWNGQATEFETMRNSPGGKNKSAEWAFKGMTNEQIAASTQKVLNHTHDMIVALPTKYHDIIAKRLNVAEEKWSSVAKIEAAHPAPAPPKPTISPSALITPAGGKVTPKAVVTPHTPASAAQYTSGQALVQHIKFNKGGVKFTQLHLDKIAALNPHGIVNGVFVTPKTASKESDLAQLGQLTKILPHGTVIKKANTTAEGMVHPEGMKVKHFVKPVAIAGQYEGAGAIFTKAKAGTVVGGVTTGHSFKLESHTEHQTVPKGSLTSTEKDAIDSWKGSAHPIRKLIGQGELTGHALGMLSALEKTPVFSGTLFRGVHGKYAQERMDEFVANGPGSYWQDTAPMGTSKNTKTPTTGAGSADLLFHITKAHDGRVIEHIGGHSAEQEVVMPYGSKYLITGIHKEPIINGKKGSPSGKVKMLVQMEQLPGYHFDNLPLKPDMIKEKIAHYTANREFYEELLQNLKKSSGLNDYTIDDIMDLALLWDADGNLTYVGPGVKLDTSGLEVAAIAEGTDVKA